ncbi:hypothetical protein S-PM2d088 [Synechococcus phage S-PM2]|uniref:Hypothetical-Protein / belonging to T4-LIKE GC: 830 n=1 Tax=Synechococcus phage S-PM2 TaxID=238854 RepID=Q5GQW5_BPSYP|nr:tail fiber protein [Synechococcus phage S-PM2]CAF34152.1 Hypothetical-Protein / belonging to T4-LIKE GC: 830 [Synechococcus phage S-PM2]CFW42222.1 hypothetical protein S-PM2d088 [Synechococcus phage S-PM2]
MSFQFNSDREEIRASSTKLVGTTNLTIRAGEGSLEKEIIRTQLDPDTGLPRVGINRTGRKVEQILVNTEGSGYTEVPNITIGPPTTAPFIQALATAIISSGRVVAIVLDNPGDGYETIPQVSIAGGGGAGATASIRLDSIDFELDITGAIRTSTSIISDTARILNLDVDNFVTPDVNYRAPNLKTWANSTGQQYVPNVFIQQGQYRFYGNNIYETLNSGITGLREGSTELLYPEHTDGVVTHGTVQFKHIGFRVDDESLPFYNETPDEGLFPRSITPKLGDRSDKIATTEYVLNLATNDVGGRIYVSEQIGDDNNDGRSAVAPVRTIKKAAQIASQTKGVKETLIISGGDYVEDNPISIPADCSIVGDNLRLVIVRPANPRKHMFKFGDKNYLTGLVFRDQVDSNGDPVATWDFAMVFDDKQRIYYDQNVGGDFERDFPIGHQIFGADRIRVPFQNNTGLNQLVAGTSLVGLNTGAEGVVNSVTFDTTTGPNAYVTGFVIAIVTSGGFNAGETFEYTIGEGENAVAYSFVSTDLVSVRAEGEVTDVGEDLVSSLPITRIDFSLQDDPETYAGGFGYVDTEGDAGGGIVFYTSALVGRQNTHEFKEGQEVLLSNLGPGLEFLEGKQRVYKVIRDADGRSRRFVVAKKTADYNISNYEPPITASVSSFSKYVTLTLLNSPNKFDIAEFVARRYQDACNLIRNNVEFIKDETYLQVLDEFKGLSVPDQAKCRRDIGHFLNAIIMDLEYGSNNHIIEAAERYIQGTQIGYIPNEITETIRAFDIARRLAILAIRNWHTGSGAYSEPLYTAKYSVLGYYRDPTVIEDTLLTDGVACSNVTQAIDTLGYLYVDIISNDAQDRYLDASYLIARNQELIIEEVIGSVSTAFPDFNYPGTDPDGYRFKDARNLIYANIDEIQDRSLAQIAIDHPDFYFPGDPASDSHSRYNDAYRLIQQNKAEIQDRALAEIAIDHPDFVFPGDPASDEHSRYNDAYRLIQQNKGEIVDTAWNNTVAIYPGIALTETKCKRDLGYFVDAISLDVFLEGNTYSRKFALMYFDNAGNPISNGLVGEETESVYAFTQARELMKDALTNQLSIKDLTVTADPVTGSNTDPNSCANVQTLVDNLVSIVNTTITNGDTSSLPAENLGFYQDNELKCRRDIGYFVDAISLDVFLESNKYSRKFVLEYFDGAGDPISNGLVGEEAESITAFEKARDVMKLAITNNLYVKDLTLTADPATGDNQDPASCANVQTLIDTLSSVVTTAIGAGSTTSLPLETIGFYQSGEFKCRRDIGYVIKAVANDLYNGGNKNIILATEYYFTSDGLPISNGLIGEEAESVTAFNAAAEFMKLAIVNGLYEKDLTITADPITGDNQDPASCANVQSNIDSLISIITTAVTNGNLNSLPSVAEDIYAAGENVCARDSRFVLGALRRDLTLDGNVGIVTAANAYFSGSELTGISQEELSPTLFAFEKLRELSILAMRNWKTGTDGTGAEYEPFYTIIPKYTDNTITTDPTLPRCNDVKNSIDTEFNILIDTLDGTVSPGDIAVTTGTLFDTTNILQFATSTIYDLNQKRVTIRADYDDLPFIEASPYTQNASVISFLGGGGAEVDGSKVQQPNCPFPGLELDGSASFPNQGKSMVAAAFTIITFGGTGYKITNDGYIQLVSVFVLFAADGILAESGGYASVTNSASNFGIFALRAIGFREEAYPFDVGTITNVSTTPTGRTIFTIDGLGREPLEHYIVNIDGYRNANPDIEFFIDAVGDVTVGPPFTAIVTLDNGSGDATSYIRESDDTAVSTSLGEFLGKTIRLHRPSIVNSSSHTWEYVGSGTDYNALPENGGTKIDANEQVSEDYGRVYSSGTDELGDFKVGTFAKIENRTGAITFTGTVTISEVEFLKLKGGDVVVTGFDASNTLGGANSSDSKIPTQKAVRDYITNNLGPYINKPYSTNAVPRALVELTDSGKISVDQIPALRPFEVYTVADEDARLAIEGALAGDIAIQQDTNTSFILNNDNSSLFVAFPPNPNYTFTIGDIFTGDLSGGQIQATEYRSGVVYQIVITDPGSGYVTPPTLTITGGNPALGAVEAKAVATIASGQVVTVEIIEFNGLFGGKGYTTQPTVTFSQPPGAGTAASGTALLESRLYGNIVNNIKIDDQDAIESSDVPADVINLSRVINTSASLSTNWVSLSSNQIAASDITSGVISSTRLANNSDAANSFTFLRGDQAYALTVQSIKGAESRYFARLITAASQGSQTLVFSTNSDILRGHAIIDNIDGIPEDTTVSSVLTTGGTTTIEISEPLDGNLASGTILEFERGASPIRLDSNFTRGNFVDNIVIVNGGNGYSNNQYFDITISGGSGTGLKANIIVENGSVTEVTVTDGGINYTSDFNVTPNPTIIGSGSGLILAAKISTVNRMYANTSIDVARVTDQTISADPYGSIGVARFLKSQFNIGTAGNGSVILKTGADSGLDADLLDGVQGSFYLNASNLSAGTLSPDRLSGTYNISVSGSSGNTLRLATTTTNPTSDPAPSSYVGGVIADTRNNSANALNDGGNTNIVLSIRTSGSGATGSGVRQLGFTDNDNMWIRGSGGGSTSFGTWAKVWTSLNDYTAGNGEGPNALRLGDQVKEWYQNAFNLRTGEVGDRQLPDYMSQKVFNTSISISSYNLLPRYKFYFAGQLLTSATFAPGTTVNLYNSNSQGIGTLLITNNQIVSDPNDSTNNYSILTGNFNAAGNIESVVTIGTAQETANVSNFSLDSGGTFEVAKLESAAGTARLSLGRKDNQSTSPSIYFNSGLTSTSTYDSAIIASGGNGTESGGSIDIRVLDPDAFTINGSLVWNAGNITFDPGFNGSNNYNTGADGLAVIRDDDGNFAANNITADITGAASENVLKTGDTMSGSLTLSGTGSNLSVGGTLGVTGNATLSGNLNVDSGTLFVNSTTNRVGVSQSTPAASLHVGNDGNLMLEGTAPQIIFRRSSDDTDIVFQEYNVDDDAFKTWAKNKNITFSSSDSVGADANHLTIKSTNGRVGINRIADDAYRLDVSGNVRISDGIVLDNAADNSGVAISFRGAQTYRNFRVGNQIDGNSLFEITPSTQNGGTTFTSPALVVKGGGGVITLSHNGIDDPSRTPQGSWTAVSGTNIIGSGSGATFDVTTNANGLPTIVVNNPGDFYAIGDQIQLAGSNFGGGANILVTINDILDGQVGIGTSVFSSTLTGERVNYQLNIEGNVNFNGTLYQNNEPFITSRWTIATNELDAYRLSKIGINKADPAYTLDVGTADGSNGDIGMTGILYVNDKPQWADKFGVIKTALNTIDEDTSLGDNTNGISIGEIFIINDAVVTIGENSSWLIS